MEMILADLELDLREIKYLTNGLSNKADKTLIEIAKRRIKEMQSHLDVLLQEIDYTLEDQEIHQEEVITENIHNNIISPVLPVETELTESTFIETQSIQTESITQEIQSNTLIVETDVIIDEGITIHTEKTVVTLAEKIKPNINLRESFTLNDTFRFSRELFNGDVDFMNHVLEEISSLETIEEVSSCLQEKLNLDNPEENEALNELLELVEKYFA